MPPTEVWLITGTSRGVGAEIVEQVLQLKYTVVIAGARFPDKSQALQDLKQQHPERLHLLCLDVASDASIQAAAKQVTRDLAITKVDYLVNNAGLATSVQSRLEEVASLREILEVNVVGVHAMIQTFLPMLQSGNKKTVINISSASGSLSTRHAEFLRRRENPSMFLSASLSYKASKAALNMLTLSWASDVTPDDGFIFVAIHPGSVSTDMTTAAFRDWGLDKKYFDLRLTPAQSVQKLLATIANLTPSNSGQFLNTDGHTFPW